MNKPLTIVAMSILRLCARFVAPVLAYVFVMKMLSEFGSLTGFYHFIPFLGGIGAILISFAVGFLLVARELVTRWWRSPFAVLLCAVVYFPVFWWFLG